MPSPDRLRRRDERTDPEPEARLPVRAPDTAAILALQRSAGNRAVQRMIFNPTTSALFVPDSYGRQHVRWQNNQVLPNPQPTDPTLVDLATDDAVFGDALATGMHLNSFSSVRSIPDATMGQNAATLVGAAPKPGTDAALTSVATDHHRLLERPRDKKYESTEELDEDVRWVMSSPYDFAPGVNDLPGPDANLKTTIIPGEKSSYWGYACVLIALVKLDNGLAKTTSLIGQTPPSEDDAVQMLHKYYVTRGVQYDDTSTRFLIMDEWGYTPIFTGTSTWDDITLHVGFTPQGRYIFDITGHTVKVTAGKTMPAGRKLKNAKSSFATHSHPDNYTPDAEFNQDIKYVWMKT
jgi:hypothetical protein